MSQRRLIDWLRLARTPGLGPVLLTRLLNHFREPAAVLAASPRELQQATGLPPHLAARLRQAPAAAPIQTELDRLQALGGQMIWWGSPLYPPLLAAIHDPPVVLFALGDPALLAGEGLLAVVGARSASRTGLAQARALGSALARQGLVTVSGLAMGIDAAAHLGALEADGTTVAVLATGLDVDYPPANRTLRERIAAAGCLLSEAPLGTPPLAPLFPNRNRILSGLCRGVVVVEAGPRSGALITARLALEQGREVFALPGVAGDPRMAGNHRLLREGAQLVEGVADIAAALAWPTDHAWELANRATSTTPQPPPIAEADLARLVARLQEGPAQADELLRIGQLTVGELSRILLQLELAGVVVRQPGALYQLLDSRRE